MDLVYLGLRRCIYGEEIKPSDLSHYPHQEFSTQPRAWNQSQHVMLASRDLMGKPLPELQPTINPLMSPTSPLAKPRDHVTTTPHSTTSRNAVTPSSVLHRDVAPLQYSLATSGFSRRFGRPGQTSEFQSPLFGSNTL